MSLLSDVVNLRNAVSHLSLDRESDGEFGSNREKYLFGLVDSSFKGIKKAGKKNEIINELGLELEKSYSNKDFEKVLILLSELEKLGKTSSKNVGFKTPSLPDEISLDVKNDLKELEKCYGIKAYRSCVILCGRILETILHRKYYEVTGMDLLEKAPGIGLGKMIAKLKEKEIDFGPGMSQQIHLINQVRVFSVHRKSSDFKPGDMQTKAIILYTLDVLNKVFKNEESM